MRWPWQRLASQDHLVLSWCAGAFSYVRARANTNGVFEIIQMGVERQGGEARDVFIKRLQSLGFKGAQAMVMLCAEQYQLLQIDTPAVPPEELRSAARYQVRDMLQTHVDDVTIDVMKVGDEQQKGSSHSFVVAATNVVVKEILDLAAELDVKVAVIDIQETAQRNLQSALARRNGVPERANAALSVLEGQQAVLTISANDELFYTRRFDVPAGFLASIWGKGVATAVDAADGFTPVEEYVPDYAVTDDSYNPGYSDARFDAPLAPSNAAADDEKAQRMVVEVQRSLDVWDRTWSALPLNGLRVYAGERSAELATWLTQQLGQPVTALDVSTIFEGFATAPWPEQTACLPLLGVLLRDGGI